MVQYSLPCKDDVTDTDGCIQKHTQMQMCSYDNVDLRAEIINAEDMIDSPPSCLSGRSFPVFVNVSDSLSR